MAPAVCGYRISVVKQAQKFDYDALVRAAEEARREIATWPEWKRRAAAAAFVSQPRSFDRAASSPGFVAPAEAESCAHTED